MSEPGTAYIVLMNRWLDEYESDQDYFGPFGTYEEATEFAKGNYAEELDNAWSVRPMTLTKVTVWERVADTLAEALRDQPQHSGPHRLTSELCLTCASTAAALALYENTRKGTDGD